MNKKKRKSISTFWLKKKITKKHFTKSFANDSVSGKKSISNEISYFFFENCFNPAIPYKTNTDPFANIADPGEMTQNKPSNQDLQFAFWLLIIWLKLLFATMDMSKFKDGRVYVKNSRGVKKAYLKL